MAWSAKIGSVLFKIFSFVGSVFVGGNLTSILKTIDNGMDETTRREEIKAEVVKKWIDSQASLLVGRTWWFQLFFVVPLGYWWTWVIIDSVHGLDRPVMSLPSPLDGWAGAIISALFLVDGGKALVSRALGR